VNRTNEVFADFEQLETEIIATARAIAAYYATLRSNGVPEQLNSNLTFEFARQWWTEQLGLNERHVFMHQPNDLGEGDE